MTQIGEIGGVIAQGMVYVRFGSVVALTPGRLRGSHQCAPSKSRSTSVDKLAAGGRLPAVVFTHHVPTFV